MHFHHIAKGGARIRAIWESHASVDNEIRFLAHRSEFVDLHTTLWIRFSKGWKETHLHRHGSVFHTNVWSVEHFPRLDHS
jgi:hypothetical protein